MFCISLGEMILTDMKLNYFLFKVLKSILPLVVNTSRSFPHSWLITDFVTRLTQWVSLVEQELLTHSEHLSSPPVFSRVRVTWSLVLYVCFVDRCLSFCTFSFGHSSSIYWFWLPLWYLQTLLTTFCFIIFKNMYFLSPWLGLLWRAQPCLSTRYLYLLILLFSLNSISVILILQDQELLPASLHQMHHRPL